MEKLLNVKKLSVPAGNCPEAFQLPALLDDNGIAFNQIDCVNWPEAYPYRPDAAFRVAHDGNEIFLEFRIRERAAAAVASHDQGEVWKDSCVEFFAALPQEGTEPAMRKYFNFECNCIGKLLLHYGAKGNRSALPAEIVGSVRRWSSLGDTPFEEKGPVSWNLVEIIPASVIFGEALNSLSGKTLLANFYKCGDNLSVPHFLSWAPISSPEPAFHLPAFFGKIIFE